MPYSLSEESTQLLVSYLKRFLCLLTLQNVALVTFSALTLWWTISATRQYRRLRHIPGPPLSGFSVLWLAHRSIKQTLHLDLHDVCKKYGSIVRVGANCIISDDPDLMRRTNAVRSEYTRTEWNKSFRIHPERDNIVSMYEDEIHTAMRNKLAMGYSGKEVDDFEGKVDRNILALIELIETKYMAKNKAFDMGAKIQYFTLDVLSDTAFSQRFGYVDADADRYGYLAMAEAIIPKIFVLNNFPWLVDILWSPRLRRFQPSENDESGIGRLMG